MSEANKTSPAAPPVRWNAADYSRNSGQQQKWARELIAKLALRPNDHVLDIGCGDGKVTAELAMAVPDGRVVGVDISEDMIRFAGAEFAAKYRNLSFQQMDAGKLRFENEFDVVFSSAVLHWVADHRPVLTGIARALKPGGRAFLQMGGKGNATTTLHSVGNLMAMLQWRPYFDGFACPYHFYGPDEYADWLKGAGLVPIRVELVPKEMVQKIPDGLAGWVRTTWMPYLNRLPEDRRDEFIAAIISDCVKRYPPDADGNAHMPMVRLEVEAKKPA